MGAGKPGRAELRGQEPWVGSVTREVGRNLELAAPLFLHLFLARGSALFSGARRGGALAALVS